MLWIGRRLIFNFKYSIKSEREVFSCHCSEIVKGFVRWCRVASVVRTT